MAHFEKTLAEHEIFSGKIVRVTVDDVELEDGRPAKREVVHHHGGACIAALDGDGCIYTVRQYRYAIGRELLELPAGKLEPREDPLKAAQRELREEVGVVADTYLDLGPIYPTVGYCNETIYCYAAKGLHLCNATPDDGEFLTIQRVPLEQLVEWILCGQVQDAKTVASLLKLDALLRAGRF